MFIFSCWDSRSQVVARPVWVGRLTLISADTMHGTFLESSGSSGHWLRLLVECGKRQVRSRYEVMARPNPRFHVFAGRLKLACSKPPMHCMGIALIVRNSKLVRQGLELHISSRDTGHSFSRPGGSRLCCTNATQKKTLEPSGPVDFLARETMRRAGERLYSAVRLHSGSKFWRRDVRGCPRVQRNAPRRAT